MTKFWNVWGATVIWLLSLVGGAIFYSTTVEVRLARIETRLEMLIHLQASPTAARYVVQTSADGH